jgi:hypothetical protein
MLNRYRISSDTPHDQAIETDHRIAGERHDVTSCDAARIFR